MGADQALIGEVEQALVLYTVQQITNMGNDATTLLNGIDSTQIRQNMDTNSTPEQRQKGMNQAAVPLQSQPF